MPPNAAFPAPIIENLAVSPASAPPGGAGRAGRAPAWREVRGSDMASGASRRKAAVRATGERRRAARKPADFRASSSPRLPPGVAGGRRRGPKERRRVPPPAAPRAVRAARAQGPGGEVRGFSGPLSVLALARPWATPRARRAIVLVRLSVSPRRREVAGGARRAPIPCYRFGRIKKRPLFLLFPRWPWTVETAIGRPIARGPSCITSKSRRNISRASPNGWDDPITSNP